MSAAQGHFQNTTPTGGIWHSLNRMVGALILVEVVIIFGIRFLPVLAERRAQQERLQQLTVEVEQEKQIVKQNALVEECLRTDAEFASLVARDRLGLAARGETIYTFPRRERDGGSGRGNR